MEYLAFSIGLGVGLLLIVVTEYLERQRCNGKK